MIILAIANIIMDITLRSKKKMTILAFQTAKRNF